MKVASLASSRAKRKQLYSTVYGYTPIYTYTTRVVVGVIIKSFNCVFVIGERTRKKLIRDKHVRTYNVALASAISAVKNAATTTVLSRTSTMY